MFVIKKLTHCFFLLALLTVSYVSFAGSEDWKGTFIIEMANKSTQEVIHTPNSVHFMFFTAGKCLIFTKGSIFNGHVFKKDVQLCTTSTVEQFLSEVQKIGPVLKKSIVLGPTY